MKLPGISPFGFVNLFFLVEKYHNIRDGGRSKKKWYPLVCVGFNADLDGDQMAHPNL